MMPARTHDWESEVEEKLTVIAALTQNFVITPQILAAYMRALASLGLDRVAQALDQFLEERDSRSPFPSIKDIRSKINPELDTESHSILIADKIVQSVRRFGHNNSDRAKEWLGEIGWRVVGGAAGYQSLCETMTHNDTTYRSQFQRIAKAHLSGGLPYAQRSALPDPRERGRGELRRIGDLTKLLPPGAGKEGASHGQNYEEDRPQGEDSQEDRDP